MLDYHPVQDNYPTMLAALLYVVWGLSLGLFVASLWKILIKLVRRERDKVKRLILAAVISPVVCVLSFYYHPGAASARHAARAATCRMNLVCIEEAKQAWAEERGASQSGKVAGGWEALEKYFKENRFTRTQWVDLRPRCPSGGSYNIGCIGEDPSCSIGDNKDVNYSWDDHTLAARRGESKKPIWRPD